MAATATADTSWTESRTTTAPAFRQTVGVNAAPSWLNTPYGDWTTVLSRIREMGATNIRASAVISTNDGWNRAVWGRLNEAVAAGIRLNLIVDYRLLDGRADRRVHRRDPYARPRVGRGVGGVAERGRHLQGSGLGLEAGGLGPPSTRR